MKKLIDTLINGNEVNDRLKGLTPLQKLTLRFVVVSLIYYGFAVIESMIMRLILASPNSLTQLVPENQYFAILTAHPLVGIFGAT